MAKKSATPKENQQKQYYICSYTGRPFKIARVQLIVTLYTYLSIPLYTADLNHFGGMVGMKICNFFKQHGNDHFIFYVRHKAIDKGYIKYVKFECIFFDNIC